MEELTAGTGSERTPHQGSMEEQTAGTGSKQTLLPGDNTFQFYDHLDSLKNNPIVNIITIEQYLHLMARTGKNTPPAGLEAV